LWSDGPGEIKLDLSAHSPTVLYRNRECLFRSSFLEERYPSARHTLPIALEAGWNHFVLRFTKTPAAFGGIFGTWLGKLPYYFLMPTAERAGQEGWLFSEPQKAELAQFPGAGMNEEATGIHWRPRAVWSKAQLAGGQCRRIFGRVPGAAAAAWTRGAFLEAGTADYRLSGRSFGPIAVAIGGRLVFSAAKAGRFSTTVRVPFGWHDVQVRTGCGARDWGFDLSFRHGVHTVVLTNPCRLEGPPHPWMYAGPLAADCPIDELAQSPDPRKLVAGLDGPTYWRLDAPGMWVRPYNDNALFGRWNYPLGVTLYGLWHGAHLIGSGEIRQYICDHLRFCSEIFEYALWDRQQYGGATSVLHLLTSIDSLDDGGSFGSTVMEVLKEADIPGARAMIDYVADYMSNRQVRLPDGTFFRKNQMHAFHDDTLWADDLYMSVPFLCRYSQLTGDARYLNDAARQFIGFRKLLFLPDRRLMAHVYDFSRQRSTGVAWGRGNGWVLFSLSELLAVLPTNHERRPELVSMFRDLAAGYLAHQDASGMWHQVLDEPDSYPETSCTAMFACAFARAVEQGWVTDPGIYAQAAIKAWEALNRISIDCGGNVHGVCRGSEFSFAAEYYKRELTWNLNDTHGIGIVLLAGVEISRLIRHQESGAVAAAAPVPPKARRAPSARRSARPRSAM
ncbi:MAG: glycoside hydrolase family 88/105 protein, partial [Opitutaceae bacterium]